MNIKDPSIKNVMIEFNLVKSNSSKDRLTKELDMIISIGKHIYLWSKTVSPRNMCQWAKDNSIYDYIYGYISKDSVNYGKADFVIDNDPKVVDRFKAKGIHGNLIENIQD